MPSQPTPGYSSGEYSLPNTRDYVVAELRYDSGIALLPSVETLTSAAVNTRNRNELNEILSGFSVKRVEPLFPLGNDEYDRRAEEALPASMPAPDSEFALAGFVRIELRNPRLSGELVDQLKQAPGVWNAYLAPRPEPANMPTGATRGSRNFEPAQGYLYDPPDGIGACAAWTQPGGTGAGVTICDVEGAWQLQHEDLPQGIKLVGGKMKYNRAWRNHGTAVLGEMVSVPNNVGCVGISHGASAAVHSVFINGVWNVAGAIVGATNALQAGDILLIEQHAKGGPNNKFLAMQFWPAEFAAIRTAVAKGVVVVEAAGNGDENFDLPVFAGTGLQKDAGAIVVGAGVPPSNYFDAYGYGGVAPSYSRIGIPRSRIWFSNYGKIVNAQGWGWHVTTLGYGDAQGGRSDKKWYTLRFSGTSSAAPMVASAAAILQGFAKNRRGQPLTPAEVRGILIKTGTPQADDAPRAPLGENIGPQPNLRAALAELELWFAG